MSRTRELLLADLCTLLMELGQDGGLISPSLYDTAQVIRLLPPTDDIWPALEWLLDQQQSDGGWGDPAVPLARTAPTLAAIVTLQTVASRGNGWSAPLGKAVRGGLEFLRSQEELWEQATPDSYPVGVELLLPHLLCAAERAGLTLLKRPYRALLASGERRREAIAQLPMRAGIPIAHTWEAWGSAAAPDWLDRSGGLGHSPSATAAWLCAAVEAPAHAREAAMCYLQAASKATRVGLAGVVPTVWPITRFEQVFALFAVYVSGMFEHPALRELYQAQISSLRAALQRGGLGMSDWFLFDGDDTAVALILLLEADGACDLSPLARFANDDHFCAYPGELAASTSVTAHAVHALQLAEQPSHRHIAYLLQRQDDNGRWPGDKWNSSWIYTTSQVLLALSTSNQPAIRSGVEALLAYQRGDGGWGVDQSNMEETAYAVLALQAWSTDPHLATPIGHAFSRARRWMIEHYRPLSLERPRRWIGKELYRPYRIAHAFELSALLALTEEQQSPAAGRKKERAL